MLSSVAVTWQDAAVHGNPDKLAKKVKIELLSGLEMLSGCTKGELATIADLAYDRSVPAGTELVKVGDFEACAFLVSRGEAEAFRGGKVVGTFGPGEVFGELALLTAKARTASVVARTDMVVLVLEPAAFQKALEASPRLAMRVLQAVGGRLAEIEDERAGKR